MPLHGEGRTFTVIQGGLTDNFVQNTLGVDVTPLRKRLIAAVNNLSKHVHGRENTVVIVNADQDAAANIIIEALSNFLYAYHDCRQAILDPIQEELDDTAIDALISETIMEVDELATHYSLDEVYVENTIIRNIGSTTITYRVTGSISVMLQWGSNSDVRRGDGAEMGESFEFYCDIEVPLDDNPWDLTLAETTYGVDTNSWYENMAPDESPPD